MKNPTAKVSLRERASVTLITGYKFPPLLHRMVDKYGWEEKHAEEVFLDTLRFLYMVGISDPDEGPMAPSVKIDEMWHNFILFTQDYQEFCFTYFGRFIHHRPRRRDDPPSEGNPIQNTLRKATQMFGQLSPNWEFKRPDGTVVDVADCDKCSASTNCQSPDCR